MVCTTVSLLNCCYLAIFHIYPYLLHIFHSFRIKGKKVKVKLSLCLTKHHAMKTYWGSGGIAPRILTSALDGGEWSASCPACFTPRERAPATHWIGSWVDPRAVLDTVVKRKIPSPHHESNPRTLIVQPVAQCYTNWAIMALVEVNYMKNIMWLD
jgi:hypothetical protein